jgi:hypothetical protein
MADTPLPPSEPWFRMLTLTRPTWVTCALLVLITVGISVGVDRAQTAAIDKAVLSSFRSDYVGQVRGRPRCRVGVGVGVEGGGGLRGQPQPFHGTTVHAPHAQRTSASTSCTNPSPPWPL